MTLVPQAQSIAEASPDVKEATLADNEGRDAPAGRLSVTRFDS